MDNPSLLIFQKGGGLLADPVIERIKSLVDLVELIGESVQLTRKGKNWWGCCPFHNEKTPSFTVNPDRGSWHCFGCGKGGDAFTFLMEKEGLNFREALEQLASRAGVALPRYEKQERKRDLYSLMEEAVGFFRSQLLGPAGGVARAYLQRRNIGAEEAARFELGWAPDSWGALTDAALAKGVALEDLIRANLSARGERGAYDRFRARVMFPIRDLSGRCIAFGGRLIDGDGPKYLNSPESGLYEKRRNLYLLHRAKNFMREKGRALLVEGYMDALRLHLCGFGETVASLGTALTADQAKLIKRFAPKVIICYDSDVAGQAATLRGMYELSAAGLEVAVLRLDGAKDPDEFLQAEGGVRAFEAAIADAQPLVLYHLELYKHSAKGVKEQADFLSALATLPHALLAEHRHALCIALMMKPDDFDVALRRASGGRRSSEPLRERGERGRDEVRETVSMADDKELMLWSLLFSDRRLAGRWKEVKAVIRSDVVKSLLASFEMVNRRSEDLEANWLENNLKLEPRLTARGDALLDRMQGDSLDIFERLLEECGRDRAKEAYDALLNKMLAEQASEDDIRNFRQLSARLRSGKIGKV